MLIRPRTQDDLQALVDMALEVRSVDGYPRYLPQSMSRFLVSDDALGGWVALLGGRVAGHVALHRSSSPAVMALASESTGLAEKDFAVVSRLLVSPPARRRGIGRALLDLGREQAALRGLRAMLDVVTDHVAAVQLYDAAGWVQVGTVSWDLPDGSPMQEHVFVSPADSS